MNNLKNNRKIFISKEDYWSKGPHWMTSASRDIWEVFWSAIRATYYDNLYNDKKNKLIVSQIKDLRLYEREVYSKLRIMRDNDNLKDFIIPDFNLKEFTSEVSTSTSMNNERSESYDGETIYKTFGEFFKNANHGWEISGDGWKIAKAFWDDLIVEINKDILTQLFEDEIKNSKRFIEEEYRISLLYLEESPEKTFTRWRIDKFIKV